MAELLLLTRVLPGAGGGAGGQGGVASAPPPPPGPLPKKKLWGEPLALGVCQVTLGALQVTLGGALLAALGDPVGAQLGAPLGSGAALIVSGSVLAAMAKNPSGGRSRAALAVSIVAAIVSLLSLWLQASLLPHPCPLCFHLGPPAQGALLGTHALLMTSSLAGAVLAVIGCVASSRARPKAGPMPVVIYQTAVPAQGAGPAEATPPAPQ